MPGRDLGPGIAVKGLTDSVRSPQTSFTAEGEELAALAAAEQKEGRSSFNLFILL